jgi:hypothetical protein
VPSRVTYLERFRENLRKFIAECTPGEDKNLGKFFARSLLALC